MMLGELISELELHSPNKRVPCGFHNPHSYRGYYDQLAFEPKDNTTVGEMLSCARQALGATYTGYKGGEFKMDEYTDVYLADWGDCGEELGPRLLACMLKEAPNED